VTKKVVGVFIAAFSCAASWTFYVMNFRCLNDSPRSSAGRMPPDRKQKESSVLTFLGFTELLFELSGPAIRLFFDLSTTCRGINRSSLLNVHNSCLRCLDPACFLGQLDRL
jgi:hypothetical protein